MPLHLYRPVQQSQYGLEQIKRVFHRNTADALKAVAEAEGKKGAKNVAS
jgi:hypothetical protein